LRSDNDGHDLSAAILDSSVVLLQLPELRVRSSATDPCEEEEDHRAFGQFVGQGHRRGIRTWKGEVRRCH
jgi:hypothetical protein